MDLGFLRPGRLSHVLVIVLLSTALAPAYASPTQRGHGLAVAPAGLVAAIAKTQTQAAAKDPSLAIAKSGCASLKADPKGASLKGCFDNSGERFASGNNTISLRLTAFGLGEYLHTYGHAHRQQHN